MRSRALGLAILVTLGAGSACSRTSPSVGTAASTTPPPAASARPKIEASARVAGPAAKPGAIPDNGWNEAERAVHALSRLAFGARPGDVERVAKMGVEAWIRAQLAKAEPKGEVDGKLAALPSTTMDIGDLAEAYPKKKQKKPKKQDAKGDEDGAPMPAQTPAHLAREIAAAKLIRAVESDRQLEEVLVDFWFNHFNVDIGKGPVRWMAAPYERDAIRAHVFGKFRDMLGATAKHPAMLFYLDNWLSSVDQGEKAKGKKKGHGLNENYARELLELHTLGVDGGYSQDDVREVARAFTGWTLEKPQGDAGFVFRPALHEPGAKKVLGTTIAQAGIAEGEKILDLVAAHPSTARFVATKLARRFVSDDPPKALVERVAAVFASTKGDLVATYEAIVFSKELWSDAARGSKIKDPFELAVSAIRAVGGTVELDEAGKKGKAAFVDPLVRQIDAMGLALYRCAPPTGYKEVASAWVGTGALVSRIRFGLAVAEGRLGKAKNDKKGTAAHGVVYDPTKLVKGPIDGEAAELLDRVAQAVLGTKLAPATRAAILAELDREPLPKDDEAAAKRRLVHAIALVLGSPDFQRQ